MTQTTSEIVNVLTNMKEVFKGELLDLARRTTFEPIYIEKTEEKWIVDEIKYIQLNDGYLKGYLLNSYDIVSRVHETESLSVKREVFLLENGELLVFNHIEDCFEESDTCFTFSKRELAVDQTLTEEEFASLISVLTGKIKNSSIE
ncbi:hypothetical protein [Virgibacillus sp. SK37]|uniref:hypothetical protein n=1 Tax=Virgibacillus sp. SK37 TaxID=403957 RepID=UPI0004D19A58|nr:hypothetical protein [Virgibacillus sp. SK37]AIF45096.1 hypothetical protein X953_01485 [Virgibacillus sp. SK37]